MDSTIDHMEITPAGPTIIVTDRVQLTATARDAAGNVVLTWPSNIQWSTPNQSVASVDSTGLVTGLDNGNAEIRVTDAESGKIGTTTVFVRFTSLDVIVR